MTSKERVRRTMEHRTADKIPAAFEAVGSVSEKLMKHYGYTQYNQILERFEIDIVTAEPKYIGPPLKEYTNQKGKRVKESYWGFEDTFHKTDVDTYPTTTYFPLNHVETFSDGYIFNGNG